MDITEEFILALFDKSVKSKASQMFKSNFSYNGHKDRMPLELFDIGFRLYKPTQTYVNFEFLASSPYGQYFQPVGLLDKDMNIYVINEYVEAYKELYASRRINEIAKIIDKKTNAVIAAFSADTISHVTEVFREFNENGWEQKVVLGFVTNPARRYDRYFECNGLLCELVFSVEGYPQFYLDDKHELEGAIGAYIQAPDGTLNIHPTVEYKELVEELNRLQLLTAFTKF